ncbi:MAG: metallophosphoesterase family protein [Nanoarchaeota archaeon]
MKILAASDLHGDISAARKLANRAKKENVNLVILCGDIESGDNAEKIIEQFVKYDKKVLLVPGNWDSFATPDFLADIFGVKNIHGYSVKYDDIGIFGCGGADIGPLTMVTEREIFNTLKKGHDKISYLKKKVMVTHMHPSGSKSEFSGISGSASIRRAIEKFKPDLLLHGHIHEASGIEEKIGKTLVLNVGREGKIIEI